MQTARHQEVPRALGRRGGDDRRLVLAEPGVPHALANAGHHVRAQRHIPLHRLAAKVQEAVPQPRLLGVFLVAEDDQRQLFRRTQNLHVPDEDLDLAGRDLGVHQFGRARLHLAVDADAPFRPQALDLVENRAVGVAQHLRDPVMVPQVDEKDTAVVANSVNPAGKAHGFSDVRGVQVCAGMAAIGVHVRSLRGVLFRVRADTPFPAPKVKAGRCGAPRKTRESGRACDELPTWCHIPASLGV